MLSPTSPALGSEQPAEIRSQNHPVPAGPTSIVNPEIISDDRRRQNVSPDVAIEILEEEVSRTKEEAVHG